MSVPPKRRTSGSVRRRRSHHALKTAFLSACPTCNRPVRPHTMCSFCGKYRGRQVIAVKTKRPSRKTS